MSVNIVEFKNGNDDILIESLTELIEQIKKNPNEIKSLLLIVHSLDTIYVVNPLHLEPFISVGQLEFAKSAIIEDTSFNVD
jgi:hypothetical protein